MSDPAYGFRDPINWEVVGEVTWTDWDYALVHALQLIEDYTDANGIPVWEKESEKMVVEAVKKIDRFEAAKSSATGGKNYKATPGEYFVPRLTKVYWADKDYYPTFEEWIQDQMESDPGYEPPEEPQFIQG